MSASLPPFFYQRFVDENGTPLFTGLVYTYEAGTTTPVTTYQDAAASIENANPIRLDAGGMCAMWLSVGAVKIVVTDGIGATAFEPTTIEGTIISTIDDVSTTSGGSNSIQAFQTIAAMQASAQTSGVAVVESYYAPVAGVPDGGGGVFYFDSSSSAAIDNGIYFSSEGSSGRWIRIFSGDLDVKWFGAKGDGATDASDAVSSCNSTAETLGKCILVSTGTYQLDTNPSFSVPVVLENGGILKWSGYALSITPIIAENDLTKHFEYTAGGTDDPVFPALCSIRNIWLDGTTSGWYQTAFAPNFVQGACGMVVTVIDNGSAWTSGTVKVTINDILFSQAFDTNKATSLTALAALINAGSMVSSAVYTDGSNSIVITPKTGNCLYVIPDYSSAVGGIDISSVKTIDRTDIDALLGRMTTAEGNITTINGEISTIDTHLSTIDQTIATFGFPTNDAFSITLVSGAASVNMVCYYAITAFKYGAKVKLTHDSGTWTNGDLTVAVNGNSAVANYTGVFATDMANMATAIAALAGMSACTYDAGTKTFLITPQSTVAITSVTVTLPSVGSITFLPARYYQINAFVTFTGDYFLMPASTNATLGSGSAAIDTKLRPPYTTFCDAGYLNTDSSEKSTVLRINTNGTIAFGLLDPSNVFNANVTSTGTGDAKIKSPFTVQYPLTNLMV